MTTALTLTTPAAAKPGPNHRRRERALGVLLLAPALTYIVLLVALPFLLAVALSFTNSSAGSLDVSFVGLQNFRSVVTSRVFQRSLTNTFVFTFVTQITVMVLGNILARALMKDFRGKSLARFLILMPWAAPISLATLGWLWIFDSTFSVINWVLKVVGSSGRAVVLLARRHHARHDRHHHHPRMADAAVLHRHPPRRAQLDPAEVHEAADIDGAGPLAKASRSPPDDAADPHVAVLFGVVFTFTDMSVVYLLTRGGPYNSTHVLASLAFQDGVLGGDVGRAPRSPSSCCRCWILRRVMLRTRGAPRWSSRARSRPAAR
jgi:multiple sugar transport system permease protein